MSPALHLTASMNVLRATQRRRRVAIKRAAYVTGIGTRAPETQALVARLEKATGVSISELATHAEQWPDD
jgi:hypothetical protein